MAMELWNQSPKSPMPCPSIGPKCFGPDQKQFNILNHVQHNFEASKRVLYLHIEYYAYGIFRQIKYCATKAQSRTAKSALWQH